MTSSADRTLRLELRRLDTGATVNLEIRWEVLERALAEAGYTLVALDRTKPGTVEHYELHKPCLTEIQKLRDVLEEIAEECDDRADADCVGDPPRYVPNIWMTLHTRIREVVPR